MAWGANKPKKPRAPLGEGALFEYAVASLGRRMRTVAELKRLMRPRVEEGEAGERTMDAVLAKLKEYKFLDDASFAAEYTRLRQENEKLGRRRVQQGLMQKGVHPELVTKTLDAAYDNVSEEGLVRQYIARKRMKPPADKKETARALRRLVGAGFSPGAVLKVLRRWTPEEESLEGLSDLDVMDAPLLEPEDES
jgi:regulatory protein